MRIHEAINQKKFKNNFHEAFINIIYTAHYLRDFQAPIFKKYNIQPQHFNILRILKGSRPQVVSPGYIKKVMLDKGHDLTRLLDKLESFGWIAREINDANKRMRLISLTENGNKITEELTQLLDQKLSNIDVLTDVEYTLLSSLLDKLRV